MSDSIQADEGATIKDGEARAIVEFFKGKPVTNDLLLEFCNKYGYTPVSTERYEDYLYSYEFDARMNAILPDIIALLGQVRWVPECASDKEREKVVDANAALTEEVGYLLEKHGVLYKEVADVTTKLSALIRQMFDSANLRVGNMAAVQLYTAGEEKFGSPLTIRAMGRAQRKGKTFHKEGKAREAELADLANEGIVPTEEPEKITADAPDVPEVAPEPASVPMAAAVDPAPAVS